MVLLYFIIFFIICIFIDSFCGFSMYHELALHDMETSPFKYPLIIFEIFNSLPRNIYWAV